MRKIIYMFIALIFFSCNNKPETKRTVIEEGYPKMIDSLSLEKYYDDTKWTIACLYCDDTVIHTGKYNSIGNKDSITYGVLPLKSTKIVLKGNDTLELCFNHYYQDSILCNYDYIMGHNRINGIAYSIIKDSVLYYHTTIGPIFISCGSPCWVREVNPLQPEVVAYIQKNKDKLDPWFRKEAIKRGVIK